MTTPQVPTVVMAPYTGPRRLTPEVEDAQRVGPRCINGLASVDRVAGVVPGPATDARATLSRAASQIFSPEHLLSVEGPEHPARGGGEMEALEHGKLSTYVNRRCRCLECSAASAAYARRRNRLKAYGRLPQPVPAVVVANHLRWLRAHGIGSARAAHLAHVGNSTITRILRADPGTRGVTPRVAAAILDVTPSIDNAADWALVDATGTHRRLQALLVSGWSLKLVEADLGIVRLDRVLRRSDVTARVARAIRGFYDANWGSCPPATTAAAIIQIEKTRSRASRAGYQPALAWDDDTIDDPASRPAGAAPPQRGVRIHLEDVEDLARFGATWDEIERRTGAIRNSIEVACGRAGRPDLVTRITSNRWVAA